MKVAANVTAVAGHGTIAAMAKVIKSTSGGDISPDTGFTDVGSVKRASIIDSSSYEARSEAQKIRDKALAEAEEIKQQALHEAVQIKEKAHEDGHKEGRAEGASELVQIVAQTSQRLAQIEEQAVPQLRDLALSIARKVLGRELEFHPDAVIDVIKQALAEKARQRREIVLRVNPEDLAILRERKHELLEVLSRAKEIGVREDPDVARFGVVIETDAGIIDAQLETQLAVFERVLKEAH